MGVSQQNCSVYSPASPTFPGNGGFSTFADPGLELEIVRVAYEDGDTVAIPGGSVGVVLKARYGTKGDMKNVTDLVHGEVSCGGISLQVNTERIAPEMTLRRAALRTLTIVYSTLQCAAVVVHCADPTLSGRYPPSGRFNDRRLYTNPSGCTVYWAAGRWQIANPQRRVVALSPEMGIFLCLSPASVPEWESSRIDKDLVFSVSALIDPDEVRAQHQRESEGQQSGVSAQRACMLRMSHPRIQKEKFSYESKLAQSKEQVKVQTMATMFPTLKNCALQTAPQDLHHAHASPLTHTQTIAPPNPPDDWAQMIRTGNTDGITWLYAPVDFAEKQGGTISASLVRSAWDKATRIVTKLLSSCGVQPVVRAGEADGGRPTSRREVKGMIRSKAQYGLLIDIITTRRCVYTGEPHSIANQLYRYVAQKYPIMVKFTFIGITDNASKRVARDMFFKGNLAAELAGQGSVGRPMRSNANMNPLDAVDNEHQYLTNPNSDYEQEYYRGLGEERQILRERIRKQRYVRTKFVPDPPPNWLVTLEEQKRKRAMPTTPDAGSADEPSTEDDVVTDHDPVASPQVVQEDCLEVEGIFDPKRSRMHGTGMEAPIMSLIAKSRRLTKHERHSSVKRMIADSQKLFEWPRQTFVRVSERAKVYERYPIAIPATKSIVPDATPMQAEE